MKHVHFIWYINAQSIRLNSEVKHRRKKNQSLLSLLYIMHARRAHASNGRTRVARVSESIKAHSDSIIKSIIYEQQVYSECDMW